MALIHSLWRETLALLAEIEARLAVPNHPLPWRRRYFRLMGVRHGRHLWVGCDLRLPPGGKLVLGERCALGDFVRIGNHAPIEIGDDFIGSTCLHMNSGGHDPITMAPLATPIRIGHRVWCGINVTILAGVTIGDDVVIAAGAVVCRDIPSNSVAAGVPARVIKPLDRKPGEQIWSWAPIGAPR